MDLRYPIGTYEPQPFSVEQRDRWIRDIAQLPHLLEAAVENLDAAQLQTAYRPGGWTVHQLVHHVADSHINAFCRMKLTLTEDNPTVKAYEENDWVQLADTAVAVNYPLTMLHALHYKMHALLKGLPEEAWKRTYVHSATQKQHSLWYLLGLYAWHGQHHVAHITALRHRNNW